MYQSLGMLTLLHAKSQLNHPQIGKTPPRDSDSHPPMKTPMSMQALRDQEEHLHLLYKATFNITERKSQKFPLNKTISLHLQSNPSQALPNQNLTQVAMFPIQKEIPDKDPERTKSRSKNSSDSLTALTDSELPKKENMPARGPSLDQHLLREMGAHLARARWALPKKDSEIARKRSSHNTSKLATSTNNSQENSTKEK